MQRAVLLATTAALALAAQPANAQVGDADEGVFTVERIVVTTQKREELAFEVPLTVSALSDEQLELLGVTQFDELSAFVPGLTVQLQSPNNPGFVIRGITSDSGNFQDPPRVSVYLNGVDVSRSRGSAFELFDLDRVEVARGPQATLFGTAASIGAVSVITARPQQEFSAGGHIGFGNYEAITLGGYMTGGNDILQGRIAGQYRFREGFIENLAGSPGSASLARQDDLNGVETFAVRPSLRFTPTPNLTADLILNYERNTPPGTSFASGVIPSSAGDTSPFGSAELAGVRGNNLLEFQGLDQTTGAPIFGLLDPATVSDFLGDDELGLDREIYDANLTVTYDLNDAFTLTGILGYREFDSLEIFDADGSQVPLVEVSEDTEGDQFSFEGRVNFDNGGRFRGFIGASYFQEDGFQRAPFALDETIFGACAAITQTGVVIAPTCLNADGSFNRVNIDPATSGVAPIIPAAGSFGIYYPAEFTNFGETNAWSVFADLSIDVTPQFEVTGGVRFIDEERTSGLQTSFPDSVLILLESLAVDPTNPVFAPLLPGFVNTGPTPIERTLDEDAVLGRLNAIYRFSDDLNVYGTISQGRRSPVFSITQTGVLEVVPEETVLNYEIGSRGSFFNDSLLLQGALFFQEYEDFRVQIVDIAAGGIRNESTGRATNTGVELEGQFIATDDLTFIGSYGYIDAAIDDDAANGDFAGNRFRLQPEHSGSLAADYRRTLFGDVEGFGTLTYTYRSDVFFESDNNPLFTEGDVSLVNLRVGLGDVTGGWQVLGYVNNLFDEEYLIDAGNTGQDFGSPTFIAGAPLLWGVELRGEF